jgi:serine/threonine-protein kinase
MSPEQARGQDVDTRADIWAFGCCLHESLSGRALFLENTVSDTLAGILKLEPDWKDLPAATPAIVRSLLRRCLAKDPNHRLQHIGDARVEIEEALAEPLFPASPEDPAAAIQSARRLLAMGAGGLAMGAALASVIVWTAFRSAESPMRDAVHFGVTLPGDLELAGDYSCPVAVSPDGRTLAFVGTSGHEDLLYLRGLGSLDLRPIPGTEGARSPFFSPDGQWVGFFAGGELRKVSVDGGVRMALCSAPGGREANWAPDDTIVFTRSSAAPALYRVPASGGPAREIAGLAAERGEMGFWSPHVLPGGHSVVFTAHSGGGLESKKIVAASMTTGDRRTLIEGGVRPRYVSSGHLL